MRVVELEPPEQVEGVKEGKLLSMRIERCTPTKEQANTRNGLNGFRLVMAYEEKPNG